MCFMFRAILTSVEDNNVDTLFAAGGALFGLSADLINRSAGRELVNKVLNDLSSPTKSAVIAEVSEGEGVALDARMETIGGTVLHDLSA
jgi:hypothetical protein